MITGEFTHNTSYCNGNLPIYARAIIVDTHRVAQDIYSVTLQVKGSHYDLKEIAGRFFMLRGTYSNIFLCRPISVYNALGDTLEFLIQEKGLGTHFLCRAKSMQNIDILGPLGNGFSSYKTRGLLCLIGGGIGIAPVSGFASILPKDSYDFYACFKSDCYGTQTLHPRKLIITTNDGSVGIKGMLDRVFNSSTVQQAGYKAVYACGPNAMLSYVKNVCEIAGLPCYLSMEARMACGVGACLGCAINTKEGIKHCCKDGPVFDSNILLFPKPKVTKDTYRNVCIEESEVNLHTTVAGVEIMNPVIAASGTFGYGKEYENIVNVASLGAICSKGLTLNAQSGNSGIRLLEVHGGILNSIGLENPGVEHFVQYELPIMLEQNPIVIANVAGKNIEDYVEAASIIDKAITSTNRGVSLIELNISCPNVKCGGMAFGKDAKMAFSVVQAVKQVVSKPLMVKLTPNAPDIVEVALSVVEAGADAISMVNTFQGTSIDIESMKFTFEARNAGLSGPAIMPIALRMAADVCQAIKALPKDKQVDIVGMGGISTWQDAVQFIMAGCAAIQIGTATFSNPKAMQDIIINMRAFMAKKGFKTIEDFRGCALR